MLKKIKLIKDDLLGGFISALVALPLTLACGLLLFKNIPELSQLGINAAIFSAIIASFISAFIGVHPLQISGPRVASSMILASFLYEMYLKLNGTVEHISLVMILFLIVTVLFSGLIQLLFGYMKFAKLIKYLPASVIIGLNATIGLIIVVKEINNNFFIGTFDRNSFFLLLVLLAVILLLFLKDFLPKKFKIIKNIIPLLAPAFGILLFYLLFSDSKPYVMSDILVEFPNLKENFSFILVNYNLVLEHFFSLFICALSIAIMNSLSALLSVATLDEKVKRNNSDISLELKGQGVGNIIASLFASSPSTGSEARGLSNYNAGGNSKYSAVFHSFTLILIVFIFSSFLVYLPSIVLTALLIHVGLLMFSPLFSLFKNLSFSCLNKPKEQRKGCLKDILQTFFVVSSMLCVYYLADDLRLALLAGFFVAIILFVYEMMRNTNYNVLDGNTFHSKKVRKKAFYEVLKKEGHIIKIVELEGAFFFATSDSLRSIIENLQDCKYIILDFRKVTEVDISGAQIIKKTIGDNPKKRFLLSHIRMGDDTYQALCSVGIIGKKGSVYYENTDLALEEAENSLLINIGYEIHDKNSLLDLQEVNVLKQFSPDELKTFKSYLEEKTFNENSFIFEEKQNASSVYFLVKGEVTILANQIGNNSNEHKLPMIRRVTLPAGYVLGEMAFFEKCNHQLSARCDSEVHLYELSMVNLDKLKQNNGELVNKFLFSVCKHFSVRLREVTSEIKVLERWN